MSKFKEKTQGFLLGLMVGLIIAGGFFVLKLDSYFKELNFYKSFIHTFTPEVKITETPEDKKEEKDKNNEKDIVLLKTKPVSRFDTSKSISENTDFNIDEDSLFAALVKDTLPENKKNASENVVVKKDELLASKTLEVINLNPTSSRANAKDSLLQKVSGVQDDKNYGRQFFSVEFWQSPLNYRGYKLSKNKMILYGIGSEDGIKLYKMDDNLYLKSVAIVYKMDYTGDFKSYERITDEGIISKLK